MSDFGADTCDFHSDYASDFCDFPGDSGSDFGREVRHHRNPWPAWRGPHHQPPRPRHREGASHRQGHRGTRTAASWQHAVKAASHGAGATATPQGHKQGPQNARGYGGIGIAPNIKTPYRRIKTANRAQSRKAAGIHRQQRKTPHSASHAGQCYFWSFARSSRSNTGCNRIYNKINGGTSFAGSSQKI